jgi:hypothetical protein
VEGNAKSIGDAVDQELEVHKFMCTAGQSLPQEVAPARKALRDFAGLLRADAVRDRDPSAEVRLAWALAIAPMGTLAEVADVLDRLTRLPYDASWACLDVARRLAAEALCAVLDGCRARASENLQ